MHAEASGMVYFRTVKGEDHMLDACARCQQLVKTMDGFRLRDGTCVHSNHQQCVAMKHNPHRHYPAHKRAQCEHKGHKPARHGSHSRLLQCMECGVWSCRRCVREGGARHGTIDNPEDSMSLIGWLRLLGVVTDQGARTPCTFLWEFPQCQIDPKCHRLPRKDEKACRKCSRKRTTGQMQCVTPSL